MELTFVYGIVLHKWQQNIFILWAFKPDCDLLLLLSSIIDKMML